MAVTIVGFSNMVIHSENERLVDVMMLFSHYDQR